MNTVLQKFVEADKQNISSENTSEVNPTEETYEILSEIKNNFKSDMLRKGKKRKVHDPWAFIEKQNEEKTVSPTKNKTSDFQQKRSSTTFLQTSEQILKLIEGNDLKHSTNNIALEKMLPPTEEELLIFQEITNSTATFQSLEEIICIVDAQLDDACLDSFLRVLQMYFPDMEFLSVHHIRFPQLIKPCQKGKDIQIFGGLRSVHWRCRKFCDGVLYIYDSLLFPSYDKLPEDEKIFIQRRYPNLPPENIVPKKITRQPDKKICGVFAGACAMSLLLGEEPTAQDYSTNQVTMRKHFFEIIKYQEIT